MSSLLRRMQKQGTAGIATEAVGFQAHSKGESVSALEACITELLEHPLGHRGRNLLQGKRKHHAWRELVHIPGLSRLHRPSVLLLAGIRQYCWELLIADPLRHALYDQQLLEVLADQNAIRIDLEIFCLAGLRTGPEVIGILHP